MAKGAACGAGRGNEPGIHSPRLRESDTTHSAEPPAAVSTKHALRAEGRVPTRVISPGPAQDAARVPVQSFCVMCGGETERRGFVGNCNRTRSECNARATFPGTAASPVVASRGRRASRWWRGIAGQDRRVNRDQRGTCAACDEMVSCACAIFFACVLPHRRSRRNRPRCVVRHDRTRRGTIPCDAMRIARVCSARRRGARSHSAARIPRREGMRAAPRGVRRIAGNARGLHPAPSVLESKARRGIPRHLRVRSLTGPEAGAYHLRAFETQDRHRRRVAVARPLACLRDPGRSGVAPPVAFSHRWIMSGPRHVARVQGFAPCGDDG